MTETDKEPKRSNWQRPIAGPVPPGASKQVAVYGGSPHLAYRRRSEARPVTFTCVVCGKVQTEYRYPGFKPKYCSGTCYQQAVEERNEKRVAQQREKRRKEREARVHAQPPEQSV